MMLNIMTFPCASIGMSDAVPGGMPVCNPVPDLHGSIGKAAQPVIDEFGKEGKPVIVQYSSIWGHCGKGRKEGGKE